jgi:hypothetical protein
MPKQVGTFTVEDAFLITGRGWVFAGEVSGTVSTGNQLLFDGDVSLPISGVSLINSRTASDKFGLLVPTKFASRQELIDKQLIGATAHILE